MLMFLLTQHKHVTVRIYVCFFPEVGIFEVGSSGFTVVLNAAQVGKGKMGGSTVVGIVST